MTTPTISFRPKAPVGTVPVSLDRLIESKLLVQANSGGGKSWAVRYLLEQTHGRLQHIVLDREGEFATLREQYPYLLVGRDGDVAADVRSAKLLARKLLELGLSAVIDLSEMSLGQQREYIRVFIDAMNNLPRSLWKDCLVVIDEAHLFAPEKGKGASVASEAIALALSTWRKRGYCMALATQRLAKLDKDVAAECLNKMIGRTSQEDLARAGDELGLGKVDAKSLRSLTPGTFWTYGPAIGPEPVLVRTGAVETHPPKRGTAREPAPVAPATIKRVMAELADLPKQAADEQRSLEELQRDLRETKAKLARAEKGGTVREVEKPVADPRAIERAVVAAVKPYKLQLARLGMKLLPLVQSLGQVAERMEAVVLEAKVQDSGAEIDGPAARPEVGVRRDMAAAGGVPVARRPIAVPRPAPGAGDAKIGKTGAKILGALAFYQSLGKTPTPASMVAAFVGMSASGGSWGARLSELRQAGFVVTGNGTIALTDEGAAVADASGLPSTLDELHDVWRAKLGGKARAMLDVLIAAYPQSVTKADLAAAIDMEMAGGSFGARLSEVRAPGLLDDAAPRGEVRASDVLFPEGL